MNETPPPLPPKTRKFLAAETKRQNGFFLSTATEEKNRVEAGPLKIVNNKRHDEDEFSPPRASQVPDTELTELQLKKTSDRDKNESETGAVKIITWAGTAKKQENVYENVETAEKKRKTPKIEVRQEENKTVVKISIKDTLTPEEEMSGQRFEFGENFYKNGYRGPDEFAVYANCEATAVKENTIYENIEKQERCYENVTGQERIYENVTEEDNFYENVSNGFYENVGGHGGRSTKKELIAEANYGDLNSDDPECDQVYKNGEFRVTKNFNVSIIDRKWRWSLERNDKDDESYENVDCHTYVNENLHRNAERKRNETAEKLESRKSEGTETVKKSSMVEVVLQKPATMVKVEKPELESLEETQSSGDAFDSGTCSDVDSIPTFVHSRKRNVIVTIKTLQGEDKSEDMKKGDIGHRRAESLTSSGVGVDSEESDDDKSNISCDSLNSNEPYAQYNSEDHGYHTPNSEDKTGSPIEQLVYENVMKDSAPTKRDSNYSEDIIQQVADVSQKLKKLRTENATIFSANLVEASDFGEYENIHAFEMRKMAKKKPAPPPPTKTTFLSLRSQLHKEEEKKLPKNLLRDIRSRSVRLSSTYPSGEQPQGGKNTTQRGIFSFNVTASDPKRLMIEEKTYEERKSENCSFKVNNICAMEVDTDKFYKFHLSENVRKKDGEDADGNDEETFAGIKDYLSREKPAAITSAKGTIRGVKNRVKAGIATFLQMHQNKTYKDKDGGKVVVYTTTMGIVRDTYHKCLKVKQILRTLMVKFEERDVFMSAEAQEEIRERMKCDAILVPQVFVEGQHIGDAETIERLNELGELRTILKPYKSAEVCSTCRICGGYRLLPCSVCKGSKKSVHRNHFTAEFVSLKCMHCDQVGLIKCYAC